MKKSTFRYALTLAASAFIGLLAPTQVNAATVSAKKDSVKVYAEAKNGAAVILELKKGDSINAGERIGMYWQVDANGQKGFVKVLDVAMKADSKSGISNMLNAAVKEGRESNNVNSTRARSTVMGVRGLDDSDETAFAGNVKPNMTLVYAMEDLSITDKRLTAHGDSVFNEIAKSSEEDSE